MENLKLETDFSIIIVNFNSGELLKNCLDSIFHHIHGSYQVIVYDNASSDDSFLHVQNIYPDSLSLTLINGDQNLGFSKANNKAVEQSCGRFLHFLNPDVIVNSELNKDYQRISRTSNQGIWVTSLVDQEGRLLKNKHLIPRLKNFINRLANRNDLAYWNTGASVLMNRSIFDQLGGWSEDTFMYAEDIDYCWRVYQAGFNIIWAPQIQVMHHENVSGIQKWGNQRLLRVSQAKIYFWMKHFGPGYTVAVGLIKILELLVQAIANFSKEILKATEVQPTKHKRQLLCCGALIQAFVNRNAWPLYLAAWRRKS